MLGALWVTTGLVGCASSSARPASGPISRSPPLASASLTQRAYLALVRTSIVPADPRIVGTAALAKIASLMGGQAEPLPRGWGTDAERDGAWLGERVAHVSSPWPVLASMARATGTAHVGLATPETRAGMQALIMGRPLSAHGFNVYPGADGRFVVFDIVHGASADRSGLRAGDVLLRIGSERVRNQVALLMPLVTLPAGERVTLEILRDGRPEELVLELRQSDVSTVESRLLPQGDGYVRIRWFARSDDPGHDTAAAARQAFTSLARQGARGLVLDLRSSLGGIGEERIASALCDGEVMYFIKQPLTEPATPVKREGERAWPERPIAILVNEQTVSAGEVLALAVRELASGTTVIGRMTAGGLTVFDVVPLASEHAMVVPTGVVLGPVTRQTPRGNAVMPDIVVPNPTVGELLSGRDRQLEAAEAALSRGVPR